MISLLQIDQFYHYFSNPLLLLLLLLLSVLFILLIAVGEVRFNVVIHLLVCYIYIYIYIYMCVYHLRNIAVVIIAFIYYFF